jgi:hypothetical protein
MTHSQMYASSMRLLVLTGIVVAAVSGIVFRLTFEASAAQSTISPDCRYVCKDSECRVMVMRCTPVKRVNRAEGTMLKRGGSTGPTRPPVPPHTGAKQ